MNTDRGYFWPATWRISMFLKLNGHWQLITAVTVHVIWYIDIRCGRRENVIDCQELHPLLLGCWSHSLSNSQAQNINEVLQISCPAISLCALFCPFVTWNSGSWTTRNHTLSRNIAIPISAMPCCAWPWAPPHGDASTTAWQEHPWGPRDVCVSWSPHCGVQPSRYTGYCTMPQSHTIKTTVNVKCKDMHCF